MTAGEPDIGHGATVASDRDLSWTERLLQVHFGYVSRRATLFDGTLRGLDRVRAFTSAFDLITQERAALRDLRQTLSEHGPDDHTTARQTFDMIEQKLDAEQNQLNQLFTIRRKPFDAFKPTVPAQPAQTATQDREDPVEDGTIAAKISTRPDHSSEGRGNEVLLLKNNISGLDQKLQSQANLMYLGISNAFRNGGSEAAKQERDIVLYHIDGWNNEIIRLRFEIGNLNVAASTIEELIGELDAVERRWNEKAKSVQQLSYNDPPAGFDPRRKLWDLRRQEFENQRDDARKIQEMIEDHNIRMSELTLRHAEDLRRSRNRGN